ncbi:hypothetical protein ACFVH6_35285 [Spirillospora sp. NPDC127200]
MYQTPPVPSARRGVPGPLVVLFTTLALAFGMVAGCAVGVGMSSTPPGDKPAAAATMPDSAPSAEEAPDAPSTPRNAITPSAPGTPSAKPKPVAPTIGPGTHRVPQDVRPGTYRSTGGEGCYWARLKDLTGEGESIIANGNPSGPTTVTIRSSDKGFENSDCGTWKKV